MIPYACGNNPDKRQFDTLSKFKVQRTKVAILICMMALVEYSVSILVIFGPIIRNKVLTTLSIITHLPPEMVESRLIRVGVETGSANYMMIWDKYECS